jgi:hypothetical protein
MNKINSFGAQYKLAKNTWNADNFFKTYDMINNPYYPFVSQSPPSTAEQNVHSDPTLWGNSAIKNCPCGKVLSHTQLAEGYATECAGCGTNPNNYHDTTEIQDHIDDYAIQQSRLQELNNELDNYDSIEKKRAEREELEKKRLYKISTGQNVDEEFESMYSTARTYGTIPMAPGYESYQVNQDLGTTYTIGARPDMTITRQGGIDYSDNASSYIKGSGTFCSETNGGKKLRF